MENKPLSLQPPSDLSADDTLSRVVLAPNIAVRWQRKAVEFLNDAVAHGVYNPADVGDEMARVEPDGSLSIYLPLPDGSELSTRVEPREWAWDGPRNH